jgi:hypothetical protein
VNIGFDAIYESRQELKAREFTNNPVCFWEYPATSFLIAVLVEPVVSSALAQIEPAFVASAMF